MCEGGWGVRKPCVLNDGYNNSQDEILSWCHDSKAVAACVTEKDVNKQELSEKCLTRTHSNAIA